jgi:hypothetical protein
MAGGMSNFGLPEPWSDAASLDAMYSFPPQDMLDGVPNFDITSGLPSPPEEPGDFIQKLANQVRSETRWLAERYRNLTSYCRTKCSLAYVGWASFRFLPSFL